MDLLIKETKTTPGISFDSSINKWIISGRSYPKEAFEFYEPVLKWISALETSDIKTCIFDFKLEFLNTNTSKIILDILVKMRRMVEQGKTKLTVTWFYEQEDEDMKETGESLMHMAKLPFQLVAY